MHTELQPVTGSKEYIYQVLLANKLTNPNQKWLAKILASWMTGASVLPDYLGLEPEQFSILCNRLFPDSLIPELALSGSQLDYTRMLEKDDLVNLLLSFSTKKAQENRWIIELVVSACLGNDHLWQDIGFWQRAELSQFLNYNFPRLAERNNKDMKWKKFLYKQLCEAEGIYLCRAPSCDVCTDDDVCFGPED